MESNFLLVKISFNPRSCTRSDGVEAYDQEYNRVSIHAPVQGATIVTSFQLDTRKFQSTLLYKERLQRLQQARTNTPVSIHAPVQGATSRTLKIMANELVSIHAPVQGATGNQVRTVVRDGVSIHAPVQGATNRPAY